MLEVEKWGAAGGARLDGVVGACRVDVQAVHVAARLVLHPRLERRAVIPHLEVQGIKGRIMKNFLEEWAGAQVAGVVVIKAISQTVHGAPCLSVQRSWSDRLSNVISRLIDLPMTSRAPTHTTNVKTNVPRPQKKLRVCQIYAPANTATRKQTKI